MIPEAESRQLKLHMALERNVFSLHSTKLRKYDERLRPSMPVMAVRPVAKLTTLKSSSIGALHSLT